MSNRQKFYPSIFFLENTFIHTIIHPSIYLSISHLCFHPSIRPSILLSNYQSIHPCTLIHSFIHIFIHLSMAFIRNNEKATVASSLSRPGNNNHVHVQGACRSLVRNSKSEDQLAVSESLEDDDEYFGQSCHTLLSSAEPPQPQLPGSAPRPVRQESSDSSSSRSKGSSSADHLVSQVLSFPKFTANLYCICLSKPQSYT